MAPIYTRSPEEASHGLERGPRDRRERLAEVLADYAGLWVAIETSEQGEERVEDSDPSFAALSERHPGSMEPVFVEDETGNTSYKSYRTS